MTVKKFTFADEGQIHITDEDIDRLCEVEDKMDKVRGKVLDLQEQLTNLRAVKMDLAQELAEVQKKTKHVLVEC